mmetsp:Transcript_6161/g.13937  ORF Transcript_6161/g.13937 Transcript_6161/m.13937 type:complete len:207 (+) Transcript_6161:1431-2051(+)
MDMTGAISSMESVSLLSNRRINDTLKRQSWERGSRSLKEGGFDKISPIAHIQHSSSLFKLCSGIGNGFFLLSFAFSGLLFPYDIANMNSLLRLWVTPFGFFGWLLLCTSVGQRATCSSESKTSFSDWGFSLGLVGFKVIAAIKLADVPPAAGPSPCSSSSSSKVSTVLSFTIRNGALDNVPWPFQAGLFDSSEFIHCDNQEYNPGT